MAESFVKTMKRDYISTMPKPDGLTVVKNLAEAFGHYNEWHPHSALGYRSPREHLRRRTSNGLSDKKCLEILGPIHAARSFIRRAATTFFQAHLLVTFFVVTPEEASLSARLNATTVTGFSSALTRLE